jgi:putative NIF3 family GTP cyclohydrolase 1 type 2
MIITCTEVKDFLDVELLKHLYPAEIPCIWQDSSRAIHKIGLALEPWTGIGEWILLNQLDSILLHRPWQLTKYTIPDHIGVLSYHLPFDEQLTVGFNKYLMSSLQMYSVIPFAEKEGRNIGMIGTIDGNMDVYVVRIIENLFNGLEESFGLRNNVIDKIACVGAITNELIHAAAAHEVQMYITGQFRKPARQAAIDTGMCVVAIGHVRSEYYGLRLLASLLTNKWPQLTAITQL